MGKRTKFQQKDTAQLVIQAQSKKSTIFIFIFIFFFIFLINFNNNNDNQKKKESSTNQVNAPKELDLNDDQLLDKVAFTEETEKNVLSATDQSILLAFW